MKFHFQQAIRAVILLAFSAMIFNLHLTGEIEKFTNPKYNGLSKIVAILFLFLFVVQFTRIFSLSHKDHLHSHNCCVHHSHNKLQSNSKKLFSYFIITVPLLTGFLIPAKTLDASIAEKKGGVMIISKKTQNTKLKEYAESVTSNESIGENLYGNEHTVDPSLIVERQEIPEKNITD
ncbi:DUF1980 domain-containing protein [Rummeliibacillus pycnus]|uniref:DUF1980 domain-containing protein n=1 Tax=Rummeliibacillus pycnus TaxID=101070 RepID=UPI0037C6C861